jgi:hypothetical protein
MRCLYVGMSEQKTAKCQTKHREKIKDTCVKPNRKIWPMTEIKRENN